MTAVDTNLLFAWLNENHAWHGLATAWMTKQMHNSELVLCELCLVELYGLLRNPAVVKRPLDAPAAVEVIRRLRSHPDWELVDCPSGRMEEVWSEAGKPGVARRRIYDLRLALALRHHGIEELATANPKDFDGLGFRRVWNPLTDG